MRRSTLGICVFAALVGDIAFAQNAVVDTLNRFTGSGPQRETARAVGVLCPAGNRLTPRLQNDCNSLVGAAFQNNANVATALRQVTADNATIPIDRSGLGKFTPIRVPGSPAGPGWSALMTDEDEVALALNGDGENSWSAYAQLRFDSDERKQSLNEDGFDRDARGLTLGADRRFGANLYVGGALSLHRSDSDYTDNSGTLDADDTAFHLYSGWQNEAGFHLDGLLGLTRSDISQVRKVGYTLGTTVVDQSYDSGFDSEERLLALTAGFRFNRDALNLNPYLRIEAIDASTDAYTERSRAPDANGAGWALSVGELEENFTRLSAGLRAAFVISGENGVYQPFLDIAWISVSGLDAQAANVRFAGDLSTNVSQSPLQFLLAADEEDDGYGSVALGVSAQWANGFAGFAGLRQNVGDDRLDTRQIDLGLRYEF